MSKLLIWEETFCQSVSKNREDILYKFGFFSTGAYRATDIMPQTKKFGIVIALQDMCRTVYSPTWLISRHVFHSFYQQAVTKSVMEYAYFLMAYETKGSVADTFLVMFFEKLSR